MTDDKEKWAEHIAVEFARFTGQRPDERYDDSRVYCTLRDGSVLTAILNYERRGPIWRLRYLADDVIEWQQLDEIDDIEGILERWGIKR